MAKNLFGFTQDLPLTLGVLALHLDSRQNVFHLGKELLKNLFEFCTMAFGKYFATFNYSFLPWHKCKSSLLNTPSPLDHDLHQIQQVEPPHVFISIQISFKYFLPSILPLGDLQRNSIFCLDFYHQTSFPS
jgi:hypothetical protein